MFKGHWRAPHETIYGQKKEDKNISIGSLYNVSIYVKWLQKLVMHSKLNEYIPNILEVTSIYIDLIYYLNESDVEPFEKDFWYPSTYLNSKK